MSRAKRSKSRNRCARCSSRQVLCVCAHAPSFDLQTRVTVVIHHQELPKTTNTGRLVPLTLKNSELRVRGARGRELATHDLVNASTRHPVLLIPSPDAIVLTHERVAGWNRPVHLIVPDGTWSQARKVLTREPGLRALPRVKLPPGPPSDYRLRSFPNAEYVSTFEAIARALGIIEGREVQKPLEAFFDLVMERALWSKGKVSASDCKLPIPDAAFQEGYTNPEAGRFGRLDLDP